MAAGDMSGDLISSAQIMDQEIVCTLQAVWVGATPVGTLSLQLSNDKIIWTDYSGSSTSVNGNGNFAWNIEMAPFQWVRVIYTFTSGTGALAINFSGKGP